MILARKVNLIEENNLIKPFISDYDINDIIFILEENEDIIGISKLKPIKEFGLLQELFIKDNKRGQGYGDGLLRATLNYCFRNNIQEVYHPTFNKYLVGKGFRLIDTSDINNEIKIYITESSILKCNTDEFFTYSCCNRRS